MLNVTGLQYKYILYPKILETKQERSFSYHILTKTIGVLPYSSKSGLIRNKIVYTPSKEIIFHN